MTNINSKIKAQFDAIKLVQGSLSVEAVDAYLAELEKSFLQIIHNFAAAPLTIGRLEKIIAENQEKLKISVDEKSGQTTLSDGERDDLEQQTGNALMQLERQKSDMGVAEENIAYIQELIAGFRAIRATL